MPTIVCCLRCEVPCHSNFIGKVLINLIGLIISVNFIRDTLEVCCCQTLVGRLGSSLKSICKSQPAFPSHLTAKSALFVSFPLQLSACQAWLHIICCQLPLFSLEGSQSHGLSVSFVRASSGHDSLWLLLCSPVACPIPLHQPHSSRLLLPCEHTLPLPQKHHVCATPPNLECRTQSSLIVLD